MSTIIIFILVKIVAFLGVERAENPVTNSLFYDTLTIKPKDSVDDIRRRAAEKEINLRYFSNGLVC